MSRALALAAGLALAGAACQLIGSNPPQGYRCEANGTCEGALVCCGDGFCRTACGNDGGSKCVGGASCASNPSAPCTIGRMTCLDGGGSACNDAELASDGTPCDAGQVCMSGACVACMDGTDCATNPAPCQVGTLSCAAGGPSCSDTSTPRAPGDPCGLNEVCTDAGECITCKANSECTSNPNVCDDGVIDCSTGTPLCLDSTHKTPGTICAVGDVCDGDGGCKPCTGGGPCTGNPDPCKDGTLSCMSGTSTCIDAALKPVGTQCGPGKLCDSNGSCSDCPVMPCSTNPTACKLGITSCASGMSSCIDSAADSTAGVPCGNNEVCDGNGGCHACTAGGACPSNPNVCKQGVTQCGTGMPACVDGPMNVTNGTPCDGGATCMSGFCGACVGGAPCTGNPTPCKAGTQDCTGGTPSCSDGASNRAAGTGCGTNRVCDGAGACVGCMAGLACSTNPNPCKQGVTSCASGAMSCVDGADQALGVACSTGFCSAGMCVACALGASCSTNPTACMNGTFTRSGAACVCSDTSNRGIGQVPGCTGAMTCNGMGACVACGATCSPSNTCQGGAISCATLTCQATGPKPDDTACTNGLCKAGSCCTGCWTGTLCVTGTTHAQCGLNGVNCKACSGTCKPGISGTMCTTGVCETCQ